MASSAGEPRSALLLATDTYADRAFTKLTAPPQDASELAGLLGDPEIGGYDVTVLSNAVCNDVRIALDELFGEVERDEQVLLYVSGHGVKDEAGNLHLVMTDTRRSRLAATAISAQYIRDLIDHSPARKIVVWLDCCYAGAFPAGMVPRAEGTVDVVAQLNNRSGRGCAVMTASTHIQYAYERGGEISSSGKIAPSVFTNAIVEGLRTGAADRDFDGEINAAELYSYVYDQVRLVTPDQTPTRNDQVSGELYIARNPLGLNLPSGVDQAIRVALRSPYRRIRNGAVAELGDMMRAGQRDASEAIRRLVLGRDPDLAMAAAEEFDGGSSAEPASTIPPERIPAPACSLPIDIGVAADGRAVSVDFALDPNFLIFANSGSAHLLTVLIQGIARQRSRKEAIFLLVDPNRTLFDVLGPERFLDRCVTVNEVGRVVQDVRKSLRDRLDKGGKWAGPELFVVVNDFYVIARSEALWPLSEYADRAAEIGLHLIIARPVLGARKALKEDRLLRILHHLRTPGLICHGFTAEGLLLDRADVALGSAGIGTLVDRNGGETRLYVTPPVATTSRTWQEDLHELDRQLRAGQISAEEFRRRGDEIIGLQDRPAGWHQPEG